MRRSVAMSAMAVSAVVAMSVAACASDSAESVEDSPAQVVSSPEPTGSNGAISFEDQRGKTITFEAEPERIVMLATSGPLIYRAVDGLADHIAGMTDRAHENYFTGDQIYAQLLSDLVDVPAGVTGEGFVPNVEAILNLDPDAVIQWASDPEHIEMLENVGLTVVGWDCCTEEQRLDYLRIAGEMAMEQERAAELIDLQNDSYEAMRELWADVPEEEFTEVLVVDQIDEQIRVVSNGSYDLGLAGAVNVGADPDSEWWTTTDVEQLLVWNPEVILIPAYAEGLSPQDFYDNPLLSELDAVANHRVYSAPLVTLSPDAPEVYLAAAWRARVLHGEDVVPDFVEELVDAYEFIYGERLTQDQINQILRADENADSADYAELFG